MLKRIFAKLRVGPFIALAITTTTVVALAGVSRLGFNDDYRSLFRADSDTCRKYEELIDQFGSQENDCLIIVQCDDVLSETSLRVIDNIHSRGKAFEGVEEIVSIYSARRPKRVGRYLLPVLLPGVHDPKMTKRARSELFQHPLVRGNLLALDGCATLLVARLAPDRSKVAEIEPVVAQLNRLLDDCTAGTNVQAALTGLPVIRAEVVRGVQRDQVVIGLAGLSLATIVGFVLFRRLSALVIVAAAPLTGVAWTLGAMGWLGEDLNVLNTVVPTLLLVIGLTDSVHLLFHIRDEIRQGQTRGAAASSALRVVGPPCMLTSLTTAIGFGSLALAQDDVIRRFGVTCALGTALTTIAVLVVVPLLAATRLGLALGGTWGGPRGNGRSSVTERVVEPILARPRLLAGGSVLLCGLMLWAALRIQPDFRYTENLSNANRAYEALQLCDEHFGGALVAHAVVQFPATATLRDNELHEVLDQVHLAVEAQDYLHHPVSFRSLLQTLPGKSPHLSGRLKELRYLPEETLRFFLNAKHRRLPVTMRVSDLGSTLLRAEFDALQSRLLEIQRHYPNYEIWLTGIPVMSSARSHQMIVDLTRSLAMASALIFGVLSIALGSLRLGLVSILPNAFPLLATAAILVAINQPLQYCSVICFSVCLGVAVDDTIHFLFRFRVQFQLLHDRQAAARSAFAQVAPVLLITTVLMLVGFSATLFSGIPTIRTFGAVSSGALVCALMGDLLILPALVTCLGPTAPNGTTKPTATRGRRTDHRGFHPTGSVSGTDSLLGDVDWR